MKKNYLFIALAATALGFASCASDDVVGGENGNDVSTSNVISFKSGANSTTRATHVGADAASLLNNKFIVSGFKGDKSADGIATTSVYDSYIVNWTENTAGKSASNTSDWEYVGVTAAAPSAINGTQTIKYWDYSTGQYDFIAYSTGNATAITTGTPTTGQVLVSAITASKTAAYTLTGATDDLAKCYIADLVTAYNTAESGKPEYGNEVTLTFRNMACKARVALYETIPGYSVKDVRFYTDEATTTADNTTITNTDATLYAPAGSNASDNFFTAGTATVSFPTVGTGNLTASDYNKAHVAIAATASSKTQAFGSLNYTTSDDTRLTTSDYLGQTSAGASYAGTASHYYTTVLPNETGTTLTLRVNYTLKSNDASGEEIHVYGAKAIVPAKYAQWKSNYAYTYIFKISDNTNGKTGITEGPEGLYPITFDAVTVDAETGTQATITTVATPSITTYQKGHDVTNDEYSAATGTIYVTVDGKTDLGTNGQLYTVSKTGTTDITEATVHDALTIGATTSGKTTTGRNGIALTTAESDATITAIPGADGNNITVDAGSYASFTPSVGTYAYVYKLTDGTASELYTAVAGDGTTKAGTDEYYTDPNGANVVTSGATLATGTTYYKKITNTNNTYAVKVIKVVA